MAQAAAQTTDDTTADILAAENVGASSTPDVRAAEKPTGSLADILKRRKELESDDRDIAKTGDKLLGDQQKQIADFMKANPYPVPKVEPWKEKPPEPDPMQGFGSWASALGIIASLRTKQPLTNSLNAAAAAINAGRQGDLAKYAEAKDTWKENSEIAIKQTDWEAKSYENALHMMETNQALGFARWKAIAAETENRGAMLMGDAGIIEHMQDYALNLKTQAQLGAERQNALDDHANMTQRFIEDQHEFVEKNKRAPTAQEKEAMWARTSNPYLAAARPTDGGGKQSPMSVALKKFMEDSPEANAKDIRDFVIGFKEDAPGVAARKEAEDQRKTAESAEKARHDQAVEDLNSRRFDTEEDRKKAVDAEHAKHDSAMEKIGQERVEKQGAMTGNEKAKIQGRIDQFDNAADDIDRATQVLDSYIGAAGIAGRATRLEERVSNIFGNSNTDRVQFMRTIELLKEISPRLLLDANGRPLSSEAGRIDSIIGGLSAGDTTANTKRSLDELKALFAKMRGDDVSILQGTWKPRDNNSPAIKPGVNRQNPAKPASQADYDALPSGAYFEDDEGVKRKP